MTIRLSTSNFRIARLLTAISCFILISLTMIILGRFRIFRAIDDLNDNAIIVIGNSHAQCAFVDSNKLKNFSESAMTMNIGLEKVRLLRNRGYQGDIVYLLDRKMLDPAVQKRWNDRKSKYSRFNFFKWLNDSRWYLCWNDFLVRESTDAFIRGNYLGQSVYYKDTTDTYGKTALVNLEYSENISEFLQELGKLDVLFMWAPGELHLVIDEAALNSLYGIEAINLNVNLDVNDYFDNEHLNVNGQKKWMRSFWDEGI